MWNDLERNIRAGVDTDGRQLTRDLSGDSGMRRGGRQGG